MSRKHVSQEIRAEVMIRSRRRCAMCFGLHRDCAEKRGQVAHIDRDSENDHIQNLIYLCLFHHDAYDTSTKQSAGFTPSEVRAYCAELYAFVANTFPSAVEGSSVTFMRSEAQPHEIDPVEAELLVSIGVDPQPRPSFSGRVSEVQTGGYWRVQRAEGHYRLLVVQFGWEHVNCEVFVQWIDLGHEGHKLRVIAVVPIKEINGAACWSVGGVVMTPAPECTIVHIPATHSYLGGERVLRIRLGPPGHYEVIEDRCAD